MLELQCSHISPPSPMVRPVAGTQSVCWITVWSFSCAAKWHVLIILRLKHGKEIILCFQNCPGTTDFLWGKKWGMICGFLWQKNPVNSTLLLFSRHVCLGVETQGETSWGAGRGKLQESLCVHCNTLCLFLDLHLGRSLSLLGVWVTAGGVQGHKPGSEIWAGQHSAPAEILLEQD